MQLYLRFIKNAVQRIFYYRGNAFTKILGKVLYLYIQISIWNALFLGNTASMAGRSREMTVTYVILSSIIACGVEFSTIELMNHKIRTGEIAIDLIRPYNMLFFSFCDGLGENLVNICLQGVPLLLLSRVLWHFELPLDLRLPAFLISILLGMLVSFLVAYFIGILAFWFLVTWPLNMFVRAVYQIFSGAWIPVWLFPEQLKNIAFLFPFQCIYYTPLTILTGNVGRQEILRLLLIQLLWVAITFTATEYAWQCGRRKLAVQGG